MSCGIYKITNLVNGKIYVGQSVDIERRFQKHLYANDDFIIHKAIKKYGRQNFSLQILEECSQELLNDREIYWIKTLNSITPNGYNMINGGSNGAGFAKGYKVIQYNLMVSIQLNIPARNGQVEKLVQIIILFVIAVME